MRVVGIVLVGSEERLLLGILTRITCEQSARLEETATQANMQLNVIPPLLGPTMHIGSQDE